MAAVDRGVFSGSIIFGVVFLLLSAHFFAKAQSLSGVRIGDNVSKRSLHLGATLATDTYKSFSVRKWGLPNGNELSITSSPAGRIVYLESDWNGRSNDTMCGLTDLKFGVTTLADLRKRFGSNGFAFQQRGAVLKKEDGVIMLNSYEFGTNVVTFITKVAGWDASLETKSGDTIAEHARLDAISIAESGYAKNEWGDRIYDTNYKKPEWK